MPNSEVRRLPGALDAPLARLAERRVELTKAWLLRLLERSSLEEIERLPTDRLARDMPAAIGGLVDAAASYDGDGIAELPAAAQVGAASLAELRVALEGSPRELMDDITALQAVAIAMLRRELADADPHLFATAVERLAAAFSTLQATAVEQLVGRRARELERLANTDELTGLYNVRFLRERLRQLGDLHRRYGHPFAILVLDIDGLKRLNDSCGHAAGDRALVAVADAVRAAIRSVDTAVRVGGDEFCVVAPQQTASRAAILAERIARMVEVADWGESPLGISIGVVACPQHGTEPDVLLELADEAMYRAKSCGESFAVAVPHGRPETAAEAK